MPLIRSQSNPFLVRPCWQSICIRPVIPPYRSYSSGDMVGNHLVYAPRPVFWDVKFSQEKPASRRVTSHQD